MHIKELTTYLDQLLEPHKFHDACPNGLQVSGKNEIKKVVTGVTACQALLDQAVAKNTDVVLVHHGYFWNKEDPRIIGVKRNRLATLIKNNINLVAYHLCLDAHPIYGNNAQLAKRFDIQLEKIVDDFLYIGKLKEAIPIDLFADMVKEKLNRAPFIISTQKHPIQKIAWCAGSAEDMIEQAASEGCDAFLTGEVTERTVHLARELGIHFLSAGHHATERYGIQALGKYLAQKFSLKVEFIDIDNPV